LLKINRHASKPLAAIRRVGDRTAGNQEGVSILEFCIILPFLTIVLLGTLDISMALINYMAWNQVVREGVRVGTGLRNMKDIRFSSRADASCPSGSICGGAAYTNAMAACTTHPGPPGLPCAHVIVHKRIRKLYDINQDLLRLDQADFHITTEFTKEGMGTASDSDTVRVVLNTQFRGIFVRSWPMQVSQVGPYLSRVDP
jgi:hypothetical protein